MKLKFRNLGQLVKFRNSFLPGIERSDSALRLGRHRLANSKLIIPSTSSLDLNDLGVNNLWNGDNLSWCRIQRAMHQ